jgi:hypothetical protein
MNGRHERDKAKKDDCSMVYFLLTAAPSVGNSSVEAIFGFSFFDTRGLIPLTTVTDEFPRNCGGR